MQFKIFSIVAALAAVASAQLTTEECTCPATTVTHTVTSYVTLPHTETQTLTLTTSTHGPWYPTTTHEPYFPTGTGTGTGVHPTGTGAPTHPPSYDPNSAASISGNVVVSILGAVAAAVVLF